MDIKQFLNNIPSTPRERSSAIKEAIDDGKIYISLINKHGYRFKIYFKDGYIIKSRQLKTSPQAIDYIRNNQSIAVLSDDARALINDD